MTIAKLCSLGTLSIFRMFFENGKRRAKKKNNE